MKIPVDAVIPKDKLTKYLLVHRDEDDKSQFLARGGFTLENPERLEWAIRALITTNEAILQRANEYGDFYQVEGGLIGANGITLEVVTIWMVQTRIDGVFRFITLKPRKKTM